MIDPELTGVDGHLVRMCPHCYATTVRFACAVLGTLRDDFTGRWGDWYECPTCRDIVHYPCHLEEPT